MSIGNGTNGYTATGSGEKPCQKLLWCVYLDRGSSGQQAELWYQELVLQYTH